MRLGKCNRVFRAPRAKISKILQSIRVLTTQILRERAAKRSDFRHRTHLRLSRERCLHLKIFATTPAGLVVCCASQTQKICNEIANFCAENLHDLGGVGVQCSRIFCVAKRCADSNENAAPPLARIHHTSRDLCSARSRNSRKFCNKFENFWLFLRGKFARSRC